MFPLPRSARLRVAGATRAQAVANAREAIELYVESLRAKLDADRAKTERDAGLGKCPKDGTRLVEREFHKVKVDNCPTCKGMWLDAGEFEILAHVDRSEISRFVGSLFGLKG